MSFSISISDDHLPFRMCTGTSHPEKSKVEGVLTSVGFTDEMQKAAVASLSGGWKMKLALGAIQLVDHIDRCHW